MRELLIAMGQVCMGIGTVCFLALVPVEALSPLHWKALVGGLSATWVANEYGRYLRARIGKQLGEKG